MNPWFYTKGFLVWTKSASRTLGNTTDGLVSPFPQKTPHLFVSAVSTCLKTLVDFTGASLLIRACLSLAVWVGKLALPASAPGALPTGDGAGVPGTPGGPGSINWVEV